MGPCDHANPELHAESQSDAVVQDAADVQDETGVRDEIAVPDDAELQDSVTVETNAKYFSDFLEDYRNKKKLYSELARQVEGCCRAVLKKIDVNGIVSSRPKSRRTLKEKLPDRAKRWTKPLTGKDDIYEKVHDLAGVRIALYFPDDVPKVTEAVLERYEQVTNPIVRTTKNQDTRTPLNDPEDDQATNSRQRDVLPAEYSDGLWRSVSAGEVVRYWKHSGYRAVHLVVRLKQNPGTEEPDEDDDYSSSSEIEKLSRKDPRDARQEVQTRAREVSAKIEIQITTVVMHAWSEVEHDIIYKNKFGLPDSSTMNRMLDGVNGLSITSEILLQELQTVFNDLRRQDEIHFDDPEILRAWLTSNYLAKDPRWSSSLFFVSRLYIALPTPMARDLRRIISKYGIAQSNVRPGPPGQVDLTVEIIKALAREHYRPSGDPLEVLLLAANAYTILMAVLHDAQSTSLIELFTMEQQTTLDQIVRLFWFPLPTDPEFVNKLVHFAFQFLHSDTVPIQSAAISLAKLGFTYEPPPKLITELSELVREGNLFNETHHYRSFWFLQRHPGNEKLAPYYSFKRQDLLLPHAPLKTAGESNRMLQHASPINQYLETYFVECDNSGEVSRKMFDTKLVDPADGQLLLDWVRGRLTKIR